MLMYLKMASSGISFERGKGLTQSSLRTATEDTEKNGGEENTRADCEAGAGWARPRREDHRARAARCGHGGDLYRLAADAGDDCVGGLIPEADIAGLKKVGIAGIFLPGTSTQDIVEFIHKRIAH